MRDFRQGAIVVLNLDPTMGREQRGVRPAVVISDNAFHASGTAIICPITTKIKQYTGNVILKPNKVNNLDEMSEVLVGQIRVVSIERMTKNIGRISSEELTLIFNGFDLLCGR